MTNIHLSAEDQLRFAETLLNPPEPNDALKRAMQRHAELVQAPPAMDDESIGRQIRQLEAERREYQRTAMAEFDRVYHAKRAALQQLCTHPHWKFTHLGPLGDPWYVCPICARTRVELEDRDDEMSSE